MKTDLRNQGKNQLCITMLNTEVHYHTMQEAIQLYMSYSQFKNHYIESHFWVYSEQIDCFEDAYKREYDIYHDEL